MSKIICKQDNEFLYIEAPIFTSECDCFYNNVFNEIEYDEEMLAKIVDEINSNIKPYLHIPKVHFDYFLPSIESKMELLLSELWLSVFHVHAETLYLHKFEISLTESMTTSDICDSEFTELFYDYDEDTESKMSGARDFLTIQCLTQETYAKTVVLKLWVTCEQNDKDMEI